MGIIEVRRPPIAVDWNDDPNTVVLIAALRPFARRTGSKGEALMTRTVPRAELVAPSKPDEVQRLQADVYRRSVPRDRLDAREATIARMLLEGLDEREVAAELFMGAVALRACLARICAKLDIPSPAELSSVVGKGTSLDFAPGRPHGPRNGRRELIEGSGLNRQEAAVLRLMRRGLDERQIAARLFIGITTVRSHQAHIQAKLGSGVLAPG